MRLTHNGEVVGLEEQFDVGAEWRLMPRSDKPDRFSLHRIRPSPDGLNQISFKAETKDDGNGLPETPHTPHSTPLCSGPIDACDKKCNSRDKASPLTRKSPPLSQVTSPA